MIEANHSVMFCLPNICLQEVSVTQMICAFVKQRNCQNTSISFEFSVPLLKIERGTNALVRYVWGTSEGGEGLR